MNTFAFERRRAEVIGRAIIPAETFNGLAGQRSLGDHFAYQIASTPWYSAAVMRLAILFVWYAPLFLKLRTFGGLSADARQQWLERLSSVDNYAIRQLIALLKMAFCFAALGQESVLRHLDAYGFGAHNLPARRVS